MNLGGGKLLRKVVGEIQITGLICIEGGR